MINRKTEFIYQIQQLGKRQRPNTRAYKSPAVVVGGMGGA